MKYTLKQRFLSWLDSYDIYDENDNVAFSVEGKFALGHSFEVYDSSHNLIGEIKQKLLSLTPTFEIYKLGECVGTIKKEFTFFTPKFDIDYRNWRMKGDIWEWDYEIYAGDTLVATCQKELFNFTDTYVFDVFNEEDIDDVLMVVVAIDAAKCSESN